MPVGLRVRERSPCAEDHDVRVEPDVDQGRAAEGRFEAGRRFCTRYRDPLGRAGLADAARRVAALLPEWG